MVKIFLTFIIIISSISAFAMPYRCKSLKLVEGVPIINFKISVNKNSYTKYRHLSNHLIGLTTNEGERYVLSEDGVGTSDTSVSFSFVENGWLVGYIELQPSGSDGDLVGDFKHSKVLNGVTEVKCVDLGDDDNRGFQQPSPDWKVEPRTNIIKVTTKVSVKSLDIGK